MADDVHIRTASEEREILILAERRRRIAQRMNLALKTGLGEYVESTVNFRLDPWQWHLCGVLESTAITTGRRILIHAPPQFGKTVIVSQRFPAWLLARKLTHRYFLAMYNITHATKHTKQIRALMSEPMYVRKFPDDGLRLPVVSSAGQFSTRSRLALNDGQPSVMALGLATGLVGSGPDTQGIDDPYADPSEARSPIINQGVWDFWESSLKPRLSAESNVIAMFHRYAENDLAGRLLATGEWEYYRYAAECDGDYQCPVSKRVYPDPLGRKPGELLSPRFNAEFIAEKKKNQHTWLSQFQGRPTAAEGEKFKIAKIEIVQTAPRRLRRCRGWDFAASRRNDADYTAGILMGFDDETATFYLIDAARGQWPPDDVRTAVVTCARNDPAKTVIRLPQDPAQAGVDQAEAYSRLLAGYPVHIETVSTDIIARAFELIAAVNVGRVKMLAGPWNGPLLEEMRTFPKGTNDDQISGGADAFTELANGGGIATDATERAAVLGMKIKEKFF